MGDEWRGNRQYIRSSSQKLFKIKGSVEIELVYCETQRYWVDWNLDGLDNKTVLKTKEFSPKTLSLDSCS